MELIKHLWHGDIPLSKTFWLFGVCVSVQFKMIFLYSAIQPQMFSTMIGQVFVWCLIIFDAIYSPFIFISIWRSGNKYKGLAPYAMLVKVMVVFGWAGYVRELVGTAKVLLD